MGRETKVEFWTRMLSYLSFYVKYIDPFLLLLTICGAAFLFILIIAKKREIRYPTTTTIAICWLLAADIGYVSCQLLTDLAYLGVIRNIQDRSEFACYVFATSLVTMVTMQGYVQAVISVERLLAVTKPLKVKLYITKFRIVGLLCLATLVCTWIGVGYLKVGIVYKELPQKKMKCEQLQGVGIVVYILMTWVIPPALITSICTIGIIKTLIMRRRKIGKDATDSQRLSSSEMRLSIMLVAMNIIFLFTSIPMSISFVSKLLFDSVKVKFFWILSVLFTSLGAFTDWIIILVLGSQLRAVLKKMCGKRRPEISSGNSTSTGVEAEHRV